MRFTVRVPADEIRAKLRSARVSFGTQQREVLEALGVRILSFAKQDYVTKSRGGTGTDGIKWKPLAQSTIDKRNRRGKANVKRKKTKSGKKRPTPGRVAIGIDTGLQLNSATPGFTAPGGGNIMRLTNTDITVGFGRFYSKYFDDKRELLPDAIPTKWRHALEDIVLRWARKLLKDSLGG